MHTSFPIDNVNKEVIKAAPFVNRRPRKPSTVHWRTDSMPSSTSGSNSTPTSMDLDALPRSSNYSRSTSSSHTDAPPPAYEDSSANMEGNSKKEARRGFRDTEKGLYAYVHAVPPAPAYQLSQEVHKTLGIADSEEKVLTHIGPESEPQRAIPIGERYRISRPYPLGARTKPKKTDEKEESTSKTTGRI
ncbi:hypothetical protein CPB84DRAFT_1850956 [Gymnopilus junonius]|uniref:Uncharacterized protein n=1 Tax=Gymnopilus junonius TaxID=109634 RepID=A0A9P5NGH1_GYMJU|nr:hypothetical protein CPB84DRAFT_1850956 [Gymnopilus junonius]